MSSLELKPSWAAVGRHGVAKRRGMRELAKELAEAASGSDTLAIQLLDLEADLDRLVRRSAASDFWLWCRHYLARQLYLEPAEMHRRIIRELLMMLDGEEPDPEHFPGRNDKMVVAVPRSHAKSSLFCFAFPLYVLHNWRRFNLFAYDSETGERAVEQAPYIVVISCTESQASDRVGDIRRELERNRALRTEFGFRKHPTMMGKWGDSDFTTIDGCRVKAAGMDSAFRGLLDDGKRPNIVILDDVDEKRNLTTAEQREKVWRRITDEIIPLGIEGRCVYLFEGTVIHYDSTLSRALDPSGEMRGWIRRKYHALPPEDTTLQKRGEPPWPAMWPKHLLIKRRGEIPAAAWAAEFQNEPADDSTTLFRSNWIKAAMARGAGRPTPINPLPVCDGLIELGVNVGNGSVSGIPTPTLDHEQQIANAIRDWQRRELFVATLQAWDFAFIDDERRAEQQRSSYNAMWHMGVDLFGNLHLCKLTRVRGLTPTETDELVLAEAALLTPDLLVMESNAAGHVTIHNVRKETGARIISRYVGARGVDKRDLYRGIPGLQRPFEDGKIIIWCGDEYNRAGAQTLYEELHRFPNAAHTDTVMALWHGWAVAQNIMTQVGHMVRSGTLSDFRANIRGDESRGRSNGQEAFPDG